MGLNLSVHDLYLIGFLVLFAVGVDIVVGNLRASYEGINNSDSGSKGLIKKGVITTVTLAMMLLLWAVTVFADTAVLVGVVVTTYSIVLFPLGYHEVQSILANLQMTYPDINVADGINKFFNVESEKVNKTRKSNKLQAELKE